ncbi:DUF998 domain-containing protein [Amycolatopsis rubida]|uniref:DUF998 domain-containing protein n=1 Tax=Amycolatopsis rubida TaxID=112413 RepID=A0A1I5ER95_9PSEU|nr:DUF998 domain-containing protein [Amycolatopsis rubida]SFO14045.1 Protein of unknown function [Amycolatopsis rubida]
MPTTSRAAVSPVSPVHGRLALVGIGAAVLIATDLHLRLSAQISPIWQTLSEYVYGRLGGHSAARLFTVMCLALALGSLALLAGLVKARRSPAVVILLGGWCAGLTICATVPVDPHGEARSFDGQLHNAAALTAFLALPTAAWLLTRRGGRSCPWEPRRTTIRWLAVASFASVAVVLGGFVFTLVTGPAQQEVTLGLFERLLFTVDLALLLTMVRPLVAASRR